MATGRRRGLRALLWELPQTALGAGAFVALALARQITERRWSRGRVFVRTRMGLGVSLGHFVFHTDVDSPFVPVGRENVDHEYGHAVQSKRLGPLYLPLVGLPSVLRVGYAIAHRTVTGERWSGYYRGWPEAHADTLGGVDRSLRPLP